MATTSIDHLSFVPKSDFIDLSTVKQEQQQHESEKDDKELEDLFDRISNYSLFDFLPFASFGRQRLYAVLESETKTCIYACFAPFSTQT